MKNARNVARKMAALLLTAVLLLSVSPIGALADQAVPVDTSPAAVEPEMPAEPAPEAPAEPAPEAPAEPAPEVTEVPAPEVTAVPEAQPTTEPEAEATAEPAPEVTDVPAPEVTEAPAPEVTEAPAPEVTEVPVPEVTAEPVPEVTAEPVPEVTEVPVPEVTAVPEAQPTTEPEAEATAEPGVSPEPSTSPEPSASPEPGADLAAVQAMVDALPALEAVQAMTPADQDAVYTQVQAAYDAFQALPAEQQAQVTGAQERFEALFGFFNAMISMIAFDIEHYYDSDGNRRDLPSGYLLAGLLEDLPLMCGYWYVVRNDITVEQVDRGENARPLQVTGSGEVNIVLLDGATLTIKNGIRFTSDNQSIKIWGGANQTGKLVVEGNYNTAIGGASSSPCGALTINGGVVEVTTRSSNMITARSVVVNRGDVHFDYRYNSNNGPVAGGTLTIAPGAYVSGGGVEKNNPVNANGEKVFPVTVAQMQQMTKNWGTGYTLDGKRYTYSAGAHGDCAMWLAAGTHDLVMESGEKITLTIGGDGAVSWVSDHSVQTFYYDPAQGRVDISAKPVTDVVEVLENDWYVVDGEVVHDSAPLRVSGNANLILPTGSHFSSTYGIYLNRGASLTIWGQNADTNQDGVIDVTNEHAEAKQTDRYVVTDWAFYNYYNIAPALGGGESFTLTINGGRINATANHPMGFSPAVGGAGVYWGAGSSVVTVNRGSLTANSSGGAPAIGVGTVSNCSLQLNVNGGTVTANQNASSYWTYAIGPSPFPPGYGSSHVHMTGGSLTANGGQGTGIAGAVTYWGGTLVSNGKTRALSEVPDFTGTPHVTKNGKTTLESTSMPKPAEDWASWWSVTITPETLTGELRGPDNITVTNSSVTDPIQVTWNGEPCMDKVQWILPDGFTLDEQWCLHIGDNVPIGTYTITARYGDRSVSFQVEVSASAYYYDPDTDKTYPISQMRDVEVVGYTLDNGWYYYDDVGGHSISVNAGASANLLLADGSTTNIINLTMGEGATLTVWAQENGTGTLSIDQTVSAAGSIVIKGGQIEALRSSAQILCPIYLRDGAMAMKTTPAAGVTVAGGSLKLPEDVRATAAVKAPGGTELVCAVIPNPTGASVVIDSQAYRLGNHAGLETGDTNLYPWLTPEDHIVLLGEESYRLIYDSESGTFQLSELLPSYSYYDPSTGVSTELTEYTQVTETTTEMINGWYVVDHTVTVAGRITVKGDVNLVLAGGVLNASQGITVNPNNALTIWSTEVGYTGRSPGWAALRADASGLKSAAGIGGGDSYYTRCGNITINGGRIDAIGGYTGGSGIGGSREAAGTAGGTITINAGTVSGTGKGDIWFGCGAGIGGGAAGVVINGGIVTAVGYSGHAGISSNGLFIDDSMTNLTVNGGSVYSTPSIVSWASQSEPVIYNVFASPVNSAGQPVYLLKLYNPAGEQVWINGKQWNMGGNAPVHVHGLTDTVKRFEAGYLYAYVPLAEDGLLHVQVGDQSYLYALKEGAFQDDVFQLVDETQLVPADYYDPQSGETKTAQYTTRFSGMVEEGAAWDLTGSTSASWYYADRDLVGGGVWFGARTISVTGNVNLILADGVTVSVDGITVNEGSSLTIWGQTDQSGTLIAGRNNATLFDSAIPGLRLAGRSSVTVNGGVVNATGAVGPGIGSNSWTDATFAINHGTVTARGGNGYPGIGSCSNGGKLYVTAKGGTINATGGSSAPGIGGVGGGQLSLTIDAGAVNATGGSGAAGIGSVGGGQLALTITGGVVKAAGGANAPGIGQDRFSKGSSMHFDGGTVTATGTDAPGIDIPGASAEDLDFTIDGGSVKIVGKAMTLQPYDRAGESVYPLVLDNPNGETVTINGEPWTPKDHTAAGAGDNKLYLYLPGKDVTVQIGEGPTVKYAFDGQNKTFVPMNATAYYDPAQPETPQSAFAVSLTAEKTAWQNGQWYVVNGTVTIPQRVIVDGDVNLILADGCSLEMTNQANITVNEGSSLTIWGQASQRGKLSVKARYAYAGIGGEPNHNAGTITINGGVINAEGGAYGAGIGGGANGGAGNITINYGIVTATGGREGRGYGGAGIGTGWDNLRKNHNAGAVTINGGVVTAIGAGTNEGSNGGGAGIGTGDDFDAGVAITITGGTVTAQGGVKAYGIGAGRYSAYTGGTTVITGGSVNASGDLGPVNPRPTNGTEPVYLLTVSNPSGAAVTLGGKPWSPVNHSALGGDTNMYAYIPGADVIADVGGVQTQYFFDNGVFTTGAEYNWAEGTWTWSEDCGSATFTVPRMDGAGQPLVRTVLTNVTAEALPTCEQAGSRTYTALVTILGVDYKDTKTITTAPATGHNWDAEGKVIKPTLSDGRTVTVYCLNDASHTISARLNEAENTDAYQAPNCGQGTNGTKFYDRTFDLNGKTYSYDTVSVTIPWSHTWSEWKPVSDTTTGITYEHECTVCGTTETTSHIHDWVLPDNTVQGNTDDVIWTLGPDEYSVTVNVTCADETCENHTTPMPVVIGTDEFLASREKSKAATCTDEGTLVYQVTLTLPGKNGNVSQTYYSAPVSLPATGHDWGKPEFKFEKNTGDPYDAGEKCTLTLHCVNKDCSASYAMDLAVTGKVTAEPTCEGAGTMTVTAETTYEGVTYSESQTRSIPAAGHDWTSAAVTWAADHSSAVVTLTCAKDKAHITTVTVSGDAITKTETPATCESQGTVNYAFDAAQAIAAAGLQYSGNTLFSDVVTTSALDHDWDVEGDDHLLEAGMDGDYTTLTIFCRNDLTHTQTVIARLVKVEEGSKPATCSVEGKVFYKMTYEFNGETHELESTPVEIPKLPHEWGPWELVPAQARATEEELWQRKCKVCGETETANHQHNFYIGENARWNVVDGAVQYVEVTATCHQCGAVETLTYSDSITVDQERSVAPGCTTEGQTVYTVTATIGEQSKTFTHAEPIPAKGHQWGLDEDKCGLSDDRGMYTFVFACSVCGQTVARTVPTVSEVLVPATCEEPGSISCRADLEMDGKPYNFTDIEPIPATGHAWDPEGDIEGLLLETKDGFVTVTIYCKNDPSHTQTVYASLTKVEEDSEPATCTEEGLNMYTPSYTFDSATYDLPQEVQYVIPALGDHLWGPDGVCLRCGEKDPDYAGVTYTWELPNPDTEPADSGRIQWSQPPLGGTPYLILIAYRHGSDGSLKRQEIVITDVTAEKYPDCEKIGHTVYSAEVEADDNSVYTYTTSIDDIAPGHQWTCDVNEDVEWINDDTQVVFTFHCGNEGHTTGDVKKTVLVSRTVTVEPTCEGEGTLMLTASAQMDSTTATVSKTETLAPLGHEWTEWTAAWSEDNSTVTFTFICSHDESHTKPVTVEAARETWQSAGCTTTGQDRLYASYTEGSVTATAEKFVETPALGHVFVDGVCTRCGEKDPDYVEPTEPSTPPETTPPSEPSTPPETTPPTEPSTEPSAPPQETDTPTGPESTPEPTAVPTAAPTAVSTATPAPTGTTAPATAPDTGDGTELLPWTVMLLACAAALAVILQARRRER